MTQAFGAGAARLAGQVALLLGWPPDAFWRATPEELSAVLTAAAPMPAGGMDRATFDTMLERDRDG